MPVTGLEGCLIFILFFYSDVVKSYREVKTGKLIYFSNLFLYFSNKW